MRSALDMKKDFQKTCNKLRRGLFLSSMMEITDGSFCSERSKGCVLVQLGAYLAEPPEYGKQKYFLPPNPDECTRFFAEECRRARRLSEVSTCLNLATPRLEWGLEAAECFHRAGGDFVELNVHGGYEPYLRLGKLRAMVLPKNRPELFKWIEAFTALDIPLIVKFRERVIKDYSPVLDKIVDFDLLGIHFNVRDEETKRPDFDFVRHLKRKYSVFLLVSGYVRSPIDVKRLFEDGADMVGIAEPTIDDPDYIHGIAKELRGAST